MNIPSLPTDNLYKFIAIFGLVLFSLSVYLDYSSFGMYTEKRIEYSNEVYKAYVESKHLVEYSNNLTDNVEGLYETIKEDENFNRDEVIEKLAELEVKREIQNDRLKQLEILIGDYDKSKEIIDLIGTKKNNIDVLSTFLRRIGGVFVLVGFLLWYSFHQRYMDAERRWKGMVYTDKLKKRQLQEKEKKEIEPKPETKSEAKNQEPETDIESKSDS